MSFIHFKNIICCFILFYKIIGIAEGSCDTNQCFIGTNLKISDLKREFISINVTFYYKFFFNKDHKMIYNIINNNLVFKNKF